MIVSTRGRYALRVLIDLAEQDSSSFVPLRDIANRQNISQKYIESIMTMLSKNGLIMGVHGKGGGYKLIKSPSEYRVNEILEITEGSLAPVACLECGAKPCERVKNCRTIDMWKDLDNKVSGYLSSITIADLMKKNA